MTVKHTPMVQAVDVWKSFGNLDVLQGINLEVMPGTVTCIIGPSGSGKSTLLRCVNHLEKVSAGRLYVDGELIGYRERDGVLYEMSEKDAAKQRRDIGMVFQNFNLFGHRTVLENIIEAPVHVKGQPVADAKTRALELLNMVGLEKKAQAYPIQLSGGQQQRVAIGRALVSGAPIILADEPTGNLDEDTAREVIEILQRAAHEQEKCVIVVTHSRQLARSADVTLRLNRRKLVVA